jgi:hypothetical protein
MVALVPAGAMAQAPAPTPAPAPAPAPTTASSSDSAPAPTGAASATPSKPVIPATGYGWSKPKANPGRPRAPRTTARKNSPDALLPGFEIEADGSTRFFVQLTQAVPFETKKARGSLTYVLKGAHVGRRNNTNPLVTAHFNTPVTSARLVPHGNDVWFVLDLRADASPAATMDTPAEGGAATLRIDFPKGNYAPATAAPPASPDDGTAPAGPSSTPSPAPPSPSSAPPNEL